jgi:hypothetical protein
MLLQLQNVLLSFLLSENMTIEMQTVCMCRLDSFGYFPGVKFLLTDVSENSVVSIIKGVCVCLYITFINVGVIFGLCQ